MASVYQTILEALLRGEIVTIHRNANGDAPRAQTIRQGVSEAYVAYKRAMGFHGIAVTKYILRITPVTDAEGSPTDGLDLQFVEHVEYIPSFTTRSVRKENQDEPAN